jgi:hypothetical protein
MPAWLVEQIGENANQIHIRKTLGRKIRQPTDDKGNFDVVPVGDVDDVVTPEGEEVVIVAPKAGYMRELSWSDVQKNFGSWRSHGGPKYDPAQSPKINTRKGEPMFICPLSGIDDPAQYEQPWKAK